MKKEDGIFVKKILKKTGRAINMYNLVEENDRVLVAISGGKDSLSLLKLLADRLRHIPIVYKIFAIHVNITNLSYQADFSYLENFCDLLNVELKIIEKPLTVFEKGESPCYNCSKSRRKNIFDFAKEIGCNKIAFGHHRDDVIETLFMNMSLQGSFSSMPPSLSIFDGAIKIIRPLYLLTNKELVRYADIMNFKPMKSICEYEDLSSREKVKKIISSFDEIYPDASRNIFKSMSNIQEEYLPKK